MTSRYLHQIQGFSRNARLYLLSAFIRGVQFGVFRLIFNLYIVSLGYRQDFLGLLRALDPLVMLLASLLAGMLSDCIGRKRALLLSNTGRLLALLGFVFAPGATGLFVSSVVLGGAKTLLHVSRLPFMMENSDDHDRTALFSAVTALWGQAGLMHAGTPLYSAFTMERVKPQQRGTVSSLRNMAWTFGRAAGQPLSGLVQVRWGFGPLFAASTALYLASAGLIWTFFSQKEKSP